jgi:metal-sulfur cluster biosynthetic enzyme
MEASSTTVHPFESRCYELLRDVYDPELNISIIDLGLVYEIHYSEDTGIKIVITLTTPGCPLGDAIINNIEEVIRIEYPSVPVDVKLTWEPEWTTDFINEEGRKQLGMS